MRARHSLEGTGSDFRGFREDGSCWQWAIAPCLTVFPLSFSFSLALSFFLFQKPSLGCSNMYAIIGLEQEYWCLAVRCARPLAHLLFNELVCFCRNTADNPLLECTPPNNAQIFTGPPICSAPFSPPSPPPSPPPLLCPPTSAPSSVGDLDSDGQLTISDVVSLINLTLGADDMGESP